MIISFPDTSFRKNVNSDNRQEEDVAEISEALKAELGRDYEVEKGRKYVHISLDGHNEYDRRRRVARKKFGVKDAEWPTDWYDQCNDPVSMYAVEFHGAHAVGIGLIIRCKLPSENLESYMSGLEECGYVRVDDKAERLVFRAPADTIRRTSFGGLPSFPLSEINPSGSLLLGLLHARKIASLTFLVFCAIMR